ncbi:unnamed protein product [Cladocopium goreaui]|uniref:Calx-beta domain-containing protein n=1 Tax=Cladocopium goreaui TaxID=2562237 RepID=A0A9P1BM31_9DINO|nr:unnamed protein product [Cladocopium goreaui]
MELSDEDVAKLLAKDIDKHKSKAAYCVGATRGLFGGKRIGDKADRQRPSMKSVVPISEEPVAIAGPPGSVEPEEPGPEPACVVEFVAKNFAVSESIGTVKLRVKRKGDLTSEVKVQYESEDGIAKAGMDYHEVKGELVFLPQEDMKEIEVPIIDDSTWEEDEEFYVHLTSIVTVKGQVSGLGRASKARIVIIDDDCPGVLSFEKDVIEVQETSKDQVIQVLVNRKGGSSGSVSCKFQTEAASATQGADYVHTEGTLTFEEGVTSQEIAVTIISKGRVYGKEEFRLIMSEAQNGLSFDPERDGGPDQSIATIVILPDEVAKSRLDRVASLLRINRDRAALGASNWKEQAALGRTYGMVIRMS